MLAPINRQKAIVYPTSDGKPVAETDRHFNEIVALERSLQRHFEFNPNVYVAANNFLYYEKGNPKACISPDVYVVIGVPKGQRDCYMVWKENERVPSAVFELTSRSTKKEDSGEKKAKCAAMGVDEYFLYDPKNECLVPPLQGFRLENAFYRQIDTEDNGRLYSRALDLQLALDESGLLQLYLPKTGQLIPRIEVSLKQIQLALDEETQARRKSETKARNALKARQAAQEKVKTAETEIAQLKEELKRLKKG